MTGLSCQVYYQ